MKKEKDFKKGFQGRSSWLLEPASVDGVVLVCWDGLLAGSTVPVLWLTELGLVSLQGRAVSSSRFWVQYAFGQQFKLSQCSFSSVQLLSHLWLFATPWITAPQAFLSITKSRSLLKLMPIELLMSSSHLILCRPLPSCPQSLPAKGSFPMSQLFTWGGQSIGVSASASVLPMNTQDLSPLGLTGWISLQSKGLSRVFSNTTVQKHQFFSAQLSSQSSSHIHT